LENEPPIDNEMPSFLIGSKMDEIQAIRLWYRYNAHLRPRYLDAIAELPPKKRALNDGASFPLFEIFLHVLDAYRWWFRYVYQDRVREYPLARFRIRIRTLKGAQRALTQTTREVHRFVSRLKEGDLDRVIEFTAPANDEWTRWRRERITMRAMLWHMVEEELQHRGEMNALLWRHGIEPPVTGIHEWPGGKAILG
jgi:uncharacterized damage-inducible protein DinB